MWNVPERMMDQEKEIARLRALNAEMLEALKRADEFITNGVEFGFVRIPLRGDDGASETPRIIREAIAKAEGAAK